jgi:hypothetical protein
MSIGPERRVSEYLISRQNADLCDACIGEHTDLSFDNVIDQVTLLAHTPVYLRDTWKCADCGAHGIVTRALPNRA